MHMALRFFFLAQSQNGLLQQHLILEVCVCEWACIYHFMRIQCPHNEVFIGNPPKR